MEDSAQARAAALIEDRPTAYRQAITLVSGSIRRANALFDPIALPYDLEGGPVDLLKPYKIALISYPLQVRLSTETLVPSAGTSEKPFILTKRNFGHFDICVYDEPGLDMIEWWVDKFKKDCQAVLEAGAKFVVYHELSYPNFWPGLPVPAGQYDRRPRLTQLRGELEAELQRFANTYRAIIIAGSYHDWETFENISHLYFPSPGLSINHKKLTAARAVYEHIRVATGVGYPVYNIGELRFCVLICSDAFDLNMFFRQILATGSGDQSLKPQIFFVPAFYINKGRRHALREACEQLSLATGAIVVFVNHAWDLECAGALYMAGVKIDLEPSGSWQIAEITPELFVQSKDEYRSVRRALKSILQVTRQTFQR